MPFDLGPSIIAASQRESEANRAALSRGAGSMGRMLGGFLRQRKERKQQYSAFKKIGESLGFDKDDMETMSLDELRGAVTGEMTKREIEAKDLDLATKRYGAELAQQKLADYQTGQERQEDIRGALSDYYGDVGAEEERYGHYLRLAGGDEDIASEAYQEQFGRPYEPPEPMVSELARLSREEGVTLTPQEYRQTFPQAPASLETRYTDIALPGGGTMTVDTATQQPVPRSMIAPPTPETETQTAALKKEKIQAEIEKIRRETEKLGKSPATERELDAPEGWSGKFPSKTEAKLFRDELASASSAKKQIAELRRMLKDLKGWENLDPAQRRKAETIRRGLMSTLRVPILGPGTVQAFEWEILEGMIPDPTAILQWEPAAEAAFDALENALETKLNESAAVYGVQRKETTTDKGSAPGGTKEQQAQQENIQATLAERGYTGPVNFDQASGAVMLTEADIELASRLPTGTPVILPDGTLNTIK